jgi:hypothetical protein
VLYVIASDGTNTYLNRSLVPAIPGTHTWPFWGTRYAEAVVLNVGINALQTSSGAPGDIMLYGISATGTTYYYQDTMALNGPSLIGPADKDKVEIVSQLTGAAQAVNFTWHRLSKATSYNLWVAMDPNFTELIATYNPMGVASSAGTVSHIAGSSLITPIFLPGNTYYWRVSASQPIGSAFSETRSFTVQPTSATVPSIGGPASGSSVNTLKPAFSWSPISGTTSYQFQISEGTAFAAPIYDAEVNVAGAQLPLTVTLEDGKTYFWRVKALTPVEGDWSSIANFTVALPVETTEPPPPVTVTNAPPITVTIPPAPPATSIVVPPPEEKVINPAYIWVIIIIGAVLVIAVIVLIVRTRRSV